VTLIIAPFNYPVSLALNPLISALAAGDTAVIKPSELCPAVADMLARLVPKYFREEVVSVVTGGIPETTALMQEAWDLVFFTGSERVGKIIAGAAAATLSPVVLELGGKSPVLVTESCPELTAMCDRIVWGKTVNCGQTCVAPDYMLCHESKLKAVTECLQQRLALQYGQDQHATSEFGRNVTAGHTQRLKDMLEEAEEAGCKVLTGGSKHADPTEKYFPTSIVCVDPAKHANLRVLKEEIFGGILPVMAYTDLDQAVRYINAQPGTPLALYVFTNDKAAFEQVANACPSGGLVRNDVLIHFATSSLPFGGLGTSGYGKGHGKHGFDAFTHQRAVLNKPCHWLYEFGGLRYAPYNKFGFLGGSGKIFASLLGIGPTIPVVNWGKFRAVCLIFFMLASLMWTGANQQGSVGLFTLANLGAGLVRAGEWLKRL